MTLFAIVGPEGPFEAALERWCGGQFDRGTVTLLGQVEETP